MSEQNQIPQLIQSSINILESTNIGEHLNEILNPQNLNPSTWRPSVDILESTTNVKIYITVPGVEADNIDIDFFNNYVTIKGERKMNTDNYQYRKKEITVGKFERKIMLPISVTNNESVNVTIKNGMLCIDINKEVEGANRFSVKPTNE